MPAMTADEWNAAHPAGATVVARDLCDLSFTADDIAVRAKLASAALAEAFQGDRDEANALAASLGHLRHARETIDALVAEIEGAA